MKIKHIATITIFLFSIGVKAQDPIFTQFFLVPETLNPAITGLANTWNAGILHRSQWPEGNRKIDTQFGFANNMITDQIGIGGTVLNQREVFTGYNYFQINGAFSYNVELENDWSIRFGLDAGFGRKSFNFKNLLLEDQINSNDGTITATSVDSAVLKDSNSINFIDLSAGFFIASENAWFGTALKHLNRPDISFTENRNVPLDLFLTLHGGYYFELEGSPLMNSLGDPTLLLTANYMRQSQYNRLDIGSILEYNRFYFGLTATTNPQGKSSNSHILTSVNPVVAFKTNEFTFGYSYDINTSKFGNSQGVHELSLTWQSSRRCDRCDNYKVKLKRNDINGFQKI